MGTFVKGLARSCALMGVAAIGAAGCGGTSAAEGASTARVKGAASPQAAVTRFLAPFGAPPKATGGGEAEQRKAVAAWYRDVCGRVDPAYRALADKSDFRWGDATSTCGALVVIATLDPGETAGVLGPTSIAGTPRAAATRGETSVVTVDVRYGVPRGGGAAGAEHPTPRRATVKVLVARSAGRWFVATPEAFNVRYVIDGGLSEAQLRAKFAAVRSGGG